MTNFSSRAVRTVSLVYCSVDRGQLQTQQTPHQGQTATTSLPLFSTHCPCLHLTSSFQFRQSVLRETKLAVAARQSCLRLRTSNSLIRISDNFICANIEMSSSTALFAFCVAFAFINGAYAGKLMFQFRITVVSHIDFL